MKNTILLTSTLLLAGFNSQICLADTSDLPDATHPTARVWVGFHFADDSSSINSSYADSLSAPVLSEAALRQGTQHAGEFYSLENSPAFGFFYKANFLI